MAAIDWDNKTISLDVCSILFPGVTVIPPESVRNRSVEVDFDTRTITIYVERQLDYNPFSMGTIEISVARTWRDVFCAIRSSGGIANISSIVGYINYYRLSGYTCGTQIMPPVDGLEWNDKLANAGIIHSRSMAENGFFSHTGLLGDDVADRVFAQGYDYAVVGENIAYGYEQIITAMQGWMNSPGHCLNIMNSEFTQVGVGVVDADDGTKYWTMVLARPAYELPEYEEPTECCVPGSVWWLRGSREDGLTGVYTLDDFPTLFVTYPAFCQWVMTAIRSYGPEESTYLLIEHTGSGGVVGSHSIDQNNVVPGMGLRQLDYYEVGEPQLVEIEACKTTYCTCCITGGKVIYDFWNIVRVELADGEIVWARKSDHVYWDEGDWVFMVKNTVCEDIDNDTDSCRKACEIEYYEGVGLPDDDETKYMIVPLKVGNHGA